MGFVQMDRLVGPSPTWRESNSMVSQVSIVEYYITEITVSRPFVHAGTVTEYMCFSGKD